MKSSQIQNQPALRMAKSEGSMNISQYTPNSNYDDISMQGLIYEHINLLAQNED